MRRRWTRGSGSVFSDGASSLRSLRTSTRFERNLERADSWLSPFRGFGPSNFLVGYPEFDFETYHDWFDERFPPAKFAQLKDKMGPMVQSCIGAFIQSLTQNPGIEEYLQSLGTQGARLRRHRPRRDHRHRDRDDRLRPRAPQVERVLGRARALRRAARAPSTAAAIRPRRAIPTSSPSAAKIGSTRSTPGKRSGPRRATTLIHYLAEAADDPIASRCRRRPDRRSSRTIRQKLNNIRALNKKWGCPDEPWAAVSPNLLWNIANIPASQVSMIGRSSDRRSRRSPPAPRSASRSRWPSMPSTSARRRRSSSA